MFCRRHKGAHRRIVETYPGWREAKENSPEDYLREIVELAETGGWVVDVAQYILSEGKALLQEIEGVQGV
ncbi:MAG: hypothetical protein ACE5KH_02665 [Candidatus Geothermarchaeales archaeon]